MPTYTVQWCKSEDFANIAGEMEVRDMTWKTDKDECNEIKLNVTDLPANERCYFRVAAGNLCGYKAFKSTLPPSVILSGTINFNSI